MGSKSAVKGNKGSINLDINVLETGAHQMEIPCPLFKPPSPPSTSVYIWNSKTLPERERGRDIQRNKGSSQSTKCGMRKIRVDTGYGRERGREVIERRDQGRTEGGRI